MWEVLMTPLASPFRHLLEIERARDRRGWLERNEANAECFGSHHEEGCGWRDCSGGWISILAGGTGWLRRRQKVRGHLWNRSHQ